MIQHILCFKAFDIGTQASYLPGQDLPDGIIHDFQATTSILVMTHVSSSLLILKGQKFLGVLSFSTVGPIQSTSFNGISKISKWLELFAIH